MPRCSGGRRRAPLVATWKPVGHKARPCPSGFSTLRGDCEADAQPVGCKHDCAQDCRGEITVRAYRDLVLAPQADARDPQHRDTGLGNGRHHGVTRPAAADREREVALPGKQNVPVGVSVAATTADPQHRVTSSGVNDMLARRVLLSTRKTGPPPAPSSCHGESENLLAGACDPGFRRVATSRPESGICCGPVSAWEPDWEP